MISNTFKKQLIVNNYKTQLLPITDKIDYEDNIERIINFLLFRTNYGKLLRYKNNVHYINNNIFLFSFYLIYQFYPIFRYSVNEDFNIQGDILFYIRKALEKKHMIDDSPNYAKYLEVVYD